MSRTTNLSPAVRRTGPRSPRARSARLRIGILLIVASVAGALVAGPFSAGAEEGPPPGPLTITKQAYWTRSLGNLAPGAATNNFPPTAVCLLVPETCGGGLAGPTSSVNDQVIKNQPEDKIPGGDKIGEQMAGGLTTLPTGVIAGNRRYLSAVQFELPQVPAGHKVSKFELHFTPVDDSRYNFHFDSPAFRQAVVAALVLAGRRDPAAFQEEAKKIGDPAHEPMSTKHLGIEACPILIDWAAGGNQDAKTAPERDSVERRGTETLAQQVNCALNASVHVIDGVWVFDLTLAANAWANGRIPNNGVLLRPVIPPNLAYGDPDLSTWDQVTFTNQVQFVFDTVEKAKPVTVPTRPPVQTQVLSAIQEPTETITETFGSPEADPLTVDVAIDEVAAPPEVRPAAPALLSGNPVTKWWTWLLLPMLLGGVFLTTQALTAEPALTTIERSGAMTRLIEARKRGLL